METWSGEEVVQRASTLLVTLAQVNATILAFILGLGIVTLQLASRFEIPRLRLRRTDTAFLLVYAGAGVIVPLLLSLRPNVVSAVALTVLSFLFIIAAPIRAARAAKAGLPLELAATAVSNAKVTRFRRHSQSERLNDAHNTLTAIRAEAAPGVVRDQVQVHLQEVLAIALRGGHDMQAARIVASVIGANDEGAERRLQSFREWLVANEDMLCSNPLAGPAAWNAVAGLCRRVDSESIELVTHATKVAASLAAGRIRADYAQAQILEALDPTGSPYVRVSEVRGSQEYDHMREVQQLATMLAEMTPDTLRGRPLFEAICELLVDPALEIPLTESPPLKIPFECASQLRSQLNAGPGQDGPNSAEMQARMSVLIRVPMQLLETAQAHGYLNTSASRRVLRGYLKWIDDAAEAGNQWLVHALVSELRDRIEAAFVGSRLGRRTVADGIDVSGLLSAVAEDLAETAAKLQHRWVEVDGWGTNSVYLFFDPISWGPEDDMPGVARRFLPALDSRIWKQSIADPSGEPPLPFPFNISRDVVGNWLGWHLRPDVSLSVLLSRWRRALAEDYRRPALAARRRQERQMDLLQSEDAETRKAWEEIHARPEPNMPWELGQESLNVVETSRALLQAAVQAHASNAGIAASTYQDWRQAAEAWLKSSTGDADPEVGQLLSSIRSLSTDDSRIIRDLLQPNEVDASFAGVRHGLWQTVFGFRTPNDQNLEGPETRYRRTDLPDRTYCLLPTVEGGSHGFAVAVEDDGSPRMLVMEQDAGTCSETIPFFFDRYLPDVILRDSIGPLLECTTCFGLTGPTRSQLVCPACDGTGLLPIHALLRQATHRFISNAPVAGVAPAPAEPSWPHRDWGGRIRVFTSQELRRNLADAVQASASA